MPTDAREALAAHALAGIPRLLTLMDRDPLSRTYGSFDRAHWHYRLMDFPCGMSQEFVLPLALVWSLPDLPGNPYRRDPVVRELILAGIGYAVRSSHPDGSCDDYYPFEKAVGAAAFSLFAMLEALEILGERLSPEAEEFLVRRARWLAEHEESGRLSNHEALIAACLARAELRYPGQGFEESLRRRLARLLTWQHAEGWFDEYGGADPGYLSLTAGLLADLDRRRPELGLRAPLARAILFLGHFVHPDGTVGGEYSSRGTLAYFPFGLEIAGGWLPAALAINDLALMPLRRGEAPRHDDDRIVGHHLWAWLMTLRDYHPRTETPVRDARRWFPGCGLWMERTGGDMLVAGVARGGVYKQFRHGRLAVSDTGPTLALRDGRVAVTHLGVPETLSVGNDRIEIAGRMSWARTARLTPAKSIVLRTGMLTLGRSFPDLVRRMLQRMLVTGVRPAPFAYRRVFTRTSSGWRVEDHVTAQNGWAEVAKAGIGAHQVSMTTIMARVYQPGQLVPFIDLTNTLRSLGPGDPLSFARDLPMAPPCDG